MTTNAMPVDQTRTAEPPDISPARILYWSVLRELWENRSIYLAPVAVGGLILIGSAISAFHLPGGMNALDLEPHDVLEEPYVLASMLLMFTTLLVAFYYCLEAFQGERRDRSILFWKSLPVSDLTTVTAKASIPLLVLPLVTFAVTAVTQALMLMLGSARFALGGGGIETLWSHLGLFQMWSALFYHLVVGHGLWYAPFYGWLLLVSAWARRAPLLWATLPLLALGLVEKIAFNTAHFAGMLLSRFAGSPAGAHPSADPMSMDALASPGLIEILASPGFWLGLSFFALCLAAAVRLRRERGPA